MAEYIEREAIYRKIAELEMLARDRYLDTPTSSPVYPRYMAQLGERTQLKFLVADFPAADVVEVKHGRWIERKSFHAEGGMSAKCSACKKDVQYLGNPLNYCPNCGARMDGE